MGYQVLDRPEGTYGYNPGFMQNVTAAAKSLKDFLDKQEKKKKDKIIREAIKNEQLTPKYEYDPATETWKESWEKSKKEETDPVKQFKKKIQQKLVLGEKISQADADAYNRVIGMSEPRIPEEMIEGAGVNLPGQAPPYNPKELTSWTQVPFMERLKSALTPSATPTEATLGPLRIGGIFKPPATLAESQPTVKLPGMAGPEVPQKDARVTQRINELKAKGWKDEDIAEALRQKGIDPSLYGL